MDHAKASRVALRLVVSRRAARTLLLALAALNLAFLAGTAVPVGQGGFLVRQLSLRVENGLGAWYSGILLLLVGAAFLLCGLASRAERSRSRAASGGFLVLAAVFAGLSLDEVGGLHEAIGEVGGLNPFEGRLGTWVGVFALPIAAATVAFVVFACRRLRSVPAAFMSFLAGVAAFASVPVQEQVEARLREATGAPRPPLHAVLEEGAEVFGALAFLAAALLYLLARAPAAPTRTEAVEVRADVPALPAALGLLAALCAAFAAFEVALPAAGVGPYLGSPAGWVGGVACLVATLAVRRDRALAPVMAIMAIDLGAGRVLTEQLFAGSPRRELALRLGLALAVALAAASASRPRLAGGVLLAAAVLLGGAAQPWLAATAALLVVWGAVGPADGPGRATPAA